MSLGVGAFIIGVLVVSSLVAGGFFLGSTSWCWLFGCWFACCGLARRLSLVKGGSVVVLTEERMVHMLIILWTLIRTYNE